MSISLLWWEYEQLLDHLRNREDIWAETGPGRWLRVHSYDDETACMGLVIGQPKSTGIFRQHVVNYLPLAWTSQQCNEYLTNLVRKWTDFGMRMQYVNFLVEEAGMDLAKAQAVAVGLLAVDQALVVPDPDAHVLPTDRSLWPDITPPDLETPPEGEQVKTLMIAGGGWLRLRARAGMLHIEASIRSSEGYGGGFGETFKGYVRPRSGNLPLAIAFLFGNPTRCENEPPMADPRFEQGRLPSDNPPMVYQQAQADVTQPEDDSQSSEGTPLRGTPEA